MIKKIKEKKPSRKVTETLSMSMMYLSCMNLLCIREQDTSPVLPTSMSAISSSFPQLDLNGVRIRSVVHSPSQTAQK